MSKIYSNHCTEISLDFGVIGEQYVDCIYDWHDANPSRDPFQPPEPAGCVLKDVLLFIDGHEVSILHWLTPARTDMICDLIREQWQ